MDIRTHLSSGAENFNLDISGILRTANLLELIMFKCGLMHVHGFACNDCFSAAMSELCKSWC